MSVPNKRMVRSLGFTLLELLVVMVLASMTAALVGSGAKSFMERSQYHQAVREVSSYLILSRSVAIRDGRAVSVTFDAAGYTLVDEAGSRYAVPAHLEVRWREMDASPKGGARPVVFMFNPDGSGQGGVFELLRGGRGVSFRLNWLLGSVEQDEVGPR